MLMLVLPLANWTMQQQKVYTHVSCFQLCFITLVLDHDHLLIYGLHSNFSDLMCNHSLLHD
jgi:hypothetical protein